MSFENQSLTVGGFIFKVSSMVAAAFLAMFVIYYFGFTPKVKAQSSQQSLKLLSEQTRGGQLFAQAEPPQPEQINAPSKMPEGHSAQNQNVPQMQIQSQPNTSVMPQQMTNGPTSAPSLGSDIGLGERDPFRPPKYLVDLEYEKSKPPPPPPKAVEPDVIDDKMEAIRRWPLEQYKLIAIIWDVKNPKAMIIDSARTMHLLKKNYRIGNREGVITSITEGEIVVTERGVPVTIKLQSNEKKK